MKSILNKKIIALFILIFFLFLFSNRIVFAIWDELPYSPGETDNPECLPSQTNCDVLPAVTIDQTVGQTIGATGARLTKLWATDITATNAITGSITGNAATVTTNANLTGVVTSTGNATAIADATLSIAKTSGLQTALDAKANSLSGTINEIAYFNSASTIASLAVATYPSLTELSYVKGLSSSAQTQLNAKQATLVSG